MLVMCLSVVKRISEWLDKVFLTHGEPISCLVATTGNIWPSSPFVSVVWSNWCLLLLRSMIQPICWFSGSWFQYCQSTWIYHLIFSKHYQFRKKVTDMGKNIGLAISAWSAVGVQLKKFFLNRWMDSKLSSVTIYWRELGKLLHHFGPILHLLKS